MSSTQLTPRVTNKTMDPRQRRPLWISLLRQISASCPSAVVWKNAEAGIGGVGDVDLVASTSDWKEVEELHLRWSMSNGLGPAVVCHHLPNTMLLVTLDHETSEILELDVKSSVTFRGSEVVKPEQLLPLSERDQEDFRRLRPGAEGLFKLVIKGGTKTGRPREATLARERVRELLRQDRAGAEAAAALFKGASPAVSVLLAAAVAGNWNRRAMLTIETRAGLRALARPRALYRRARSISAARSCPVIGARTSGRQVEGDHREWLERVGAGHAVNDSWKHP